MNSLKTQPNERRYAGIEEVHELDLPECCPVSRNPRGGSRLRIEYEPGDRFLEVFSLHKYINEYIGGREEVRSMEGMIQEIAQDCANAVGVPVKAVARLNIHPSQKMILTCTGEPTTRNRKRPMETKTETLADVLRDLGYMLPQQFEIQIHKGWADFVRLRWSGAATLLTQFSNAISPNLEAAIVATCLHVCEERGWDWDLSRITIGAGDYKHWLAVIVTLNRGHISAESIDSPGLALATALRDALSAPVRPQDSRCDR